MTDDTVVPNYVKGQHLGMELPTALSVLKKAGPNYLTKAFRATGVLSAANAVTEITRWEEFEAGGMGPKLRLDVRYATSEPQLHTELFVKLPRPFGDPLRALFAPVVEPEIRLYLLARHRNFPARLPKLYFADFDPETASSVVITERISYGANGIEPCHDKAMDYRLADLRPYYEALSVAGARLAGTHRAGRLDPDVSVYFPEETGAVEVGAQIPYSPQELVHKGQVLQDFAEKAPQLFPAHLKDKAFLGQVAESLPRILHRQDAIRAHLASASSYFALCHWNLNLDNAWFWKDEAGLLQAGLLDWGAAGVMHLAQSYFGMICAAETDFASKYRNHLIALWCETYKQAGGPVLDPARFLEDYKLAVALLGAAWIVDAPSIIQGQIPDVSILQGRHDPQLAGNFLARSQLQILMLFLNEWRDLEIDRALSQLPG